MSLSLRLRRSLILLICLTGGLSSLEALAAPNLRSTFPGRRVGGGTRGDCTARVVVHLVPAASVFAPATDRTVGLLEGPAHDPRPLVLDFRPASTDAQAKPSSRTLTATPAGITLFTLPASQDALRWTSSYRCSSPGETGPRDPLSFVETTAPPTLSLIVADVTPADQQVQAALKRLRRACGSTVSRDALSAEFGLNDVITPDWPAALPVRCL